MEPPQDCEHNQTAIWRFQDQGRWMRVAPRLTGITATGIG